MQLTFTICEHSLILFLAGILLANVFRTMVGKDGVKYLMEDMNVLNAPKLLNFW